MPDLDALLRFLSVVESGSFSAAARRLGVSRQAVQRSVDVLERQSGVQLLERTTRRLRVTDAGRRLIPLVHTIRDAGHEADALLSAATSRPTGRIRLSAPPLFAETVLVRVLPGFLAQWPEVDVEAQFSTARMDPFEADLDLTIRIGVAPPENAYAVSLGRASQVLCASPDYLMAHPAPAHPDQLAGHELLAYGQGVRSWSFDGPDGAVTVATRFRLHTNSAPIMVAACLAGLGILKVPQLAVAPRLAAGDLCCVLPEWTIAASQVWAVYGHRAATDPTLQAFLDALRAVPW